ncbi:unnamed protein product [Eruca vesicaria subsp. sativa]|uniref:Uncharacterized protein n=1 Tax=Eruca vesicaria subsp. sativa TaxID=29727 RepID=A0ABC8INC2_ERUVS|nr:unnamed protein product [Eruca vesicaria subsp. sativa]
MIALFLNQRVVKPKRSHVITLEQQSDPGIQLHYRKSSHLVTFLQARKGDTKMLLQVGQEQDSSRQSQLSISSLHLHIDRNIREDIFGDLIATARSWWYVHDDVYGDLSLAVSRLTLHPWRLVRVVQNTVHTDRSRNHPRSAVRLESEVC